MVIVRDQWESKQSVFEAELFTMLGTPWKVAIDVACVYSLGKERVATESPGQMFAE